ncbi:MAG: hypothetical protein ACHQRK_08995 [Gemmatimonadales bacterium]
MRCLGRIGCVALVVVVLLAAWITRDRWLRYVPGAHPVASTEPLWEPLSPEAAARGRKAIDALSTSTGPVFANLKAAEIASYVFEQAGSRLPARTDSAEAAVIGDVLYVRALVPTKDIAKSGALGPLGGFLNDYERLTLGGSFHVIRPGLSEFELRDVKLREFSIPHAAIPRLVKQLDHGARPDGLSPEGIAVKTPPSLADVRIANHRVTLYKSTAGATP